MNEQHIALGKFGYQITYALEHYQPHGFHASQFSSIVLGGLGGSGIGGKLIKSIFSKDCPIPVECVADYSIPAYAGKNTLVILGSYSGNTEETLSMYHEAKQRGCTILVLTGGGKLLQLATQDKIPHNVVELGFQPRMALGFSLTFMVLIFAELLGMDVKDQLTAVAAKVADPHIYQEEATAIFESIKSKVKSKLVVLTDAFFEPVGIRFGQQINENAKHECFQHTVPEMNHNVIESYYGQLDSVYFLIDSHHNSRVSARFEFLNNLLEVENNKVIHVPVDDTDIAGVYEVIYTLDWLSIYISDYRRVDSLNVPNIASLKEFLDTVN